MDVIGKHINQLMVGIVILNYNNIDDTIKCINSIFEYCDTSMFRICLVDNNSRTEVVGKVHQALCKRENYMLLHNTEPKPAVLPVLTHILNKQNGGYAQGNNLGLNFLKSYSEINYYLILNNDVIFTMDIIKPLKQYLSTHPIAGVVSPLLYGRDGQIDYECCRYEKKQMDFLVRVFHLDRFHLFAKLRQRNYILKRHPEYLKKDEVEGNLPSGSCMMFRKASFEQINFFDPNTFLYFEEDIIWKKLKAVNLKSILLTQVSCIHLGACSTSKSSSNIVSEAYRNSLRYYIKNISGFSTAFVFILLVRLRLHISQ